MDLIDRAQDEADLHLKHSLATRQYTAPATGKCHWCDEPAPAGAQLCSVDCQVDFDKFQRRAR